MRVTWSGERYVNPILLDFVDGVPYLVVLSRAIYSRATQYGCPEVPYAFLRYDVAGRRWLPIPRSDAPEVLKTANLSMEYRSYWDGRRQVRQSKEDIAGTNRVLEASSSRFYSATIPGSLSAWSYREKERFANTRYSNDCRPPVAEPVDSINPKSSASHSTPVTPEILESKSYEQPVVMSSEEWKRLTWNPGRSENCKALLGPANRDNPRLDTYSAFIRNPNRVTRNRMWICDDDALWAIDYVVERGRVVLIKANSMGDVLYRISFESLARSGAYSGSISQSSLREEGGYAYFDWWDSTQSGTDRIVHRNLKVRVPVSANSR